jgi:hypothetical protein
MNELEIASQCNSHVDMREQGAHNPRAVDRRRDNRTSRFYIIDDHGTQELRTDHALIALWLARRSRLRSGVRWR